MKVEGENRERQAETCSVTRYLSHMQDKEFYVLNYVKRNACINHVWVIQVA